jgi:hypothetical protein
MVKTARWLERASCRPAGDGKNKNRWEQSGQRKNSTEAHICPSLIVAQMPSNQMIRRAQGRASEQESFRKRWRMNQMLQKALFLSDCRRNYPQSCYKKAF